MTNILLVNGSVREGRTSDKVQALVESELAKRSDVSVVITDFKKTPLPFFDNAQNPASDDFTTDNEHAKAWAEQVKTADYVIFLVAEYNHSYTPVLKNAVDWLYKEWNEKPVAFVGYGWVGGSRATKHLRDVMNSNISSKPFEKEVNLGFTKDIELTGEPIGDTASQEIASLIEAFIPA